MSKTIVTLVTVPHLCGGKNCPPEDRGKIVTRPALRFPDGKLKICDSMPDIEAWVSRWNLEIAPDA